MKKIISLGAGLVVGLLLCLAIGYTITAFSTTGTSKTISNRSAQFSWNRAARFGSGMQWTGMAPGWSGQFFGWTGRNGTGALLGSGRRMSATGANVSAEELFNQERAQ